MSTKKSNESTTSNFEDYYFSKRAEENHENATPMEQCSAARNSMVRIFNESVKSLSNESTCLLLKNGLSDYSELLFDDSKSNSVNGFTQPIEYLLKGRVKTNHCTEWKSNLSLSKINPVKLMKESLQSNKHCDIKNDRPCNSDLPTHDDLQFFNNEDHSATTFPILEKVNTKEKITNYNSSFNIAKKNDVLFKSVPLSRDVSKGNSFTYKNPNVRNQSDNFPIRSNNTVRAPEKNQKSFSEQNSPKSTDEKSLPFKTAHEELMIQNKKKYGNQYHNLPQHQQDNGGRKKTLGTSKSVTSKFVSPFLQNDENNKKEPEIVLEDGLEHLDPKMVTLIMNEIADLSGAQVNWEDIAGLEFAKTVIQEAVVWPLLRPDIFTGLRKPPKGILLFGPPGTGKTLIGKCIASQANATFFSISASSLTSKWIGEGEKMVRTLFSVARCKQPAVVFIDEIDSLLTARSDTEHECTRRIKTEFLVQLDGVAIDNSDRVLLVGATNRPQDLDEAARRRLVKRLYIPLPDLSARSQLVSREIGSVKNSLTEDDIHDIAQQTDGYSGADMRSLCTEAAYGPIRSVPLSQFTNIENEQIRAVNISDFHKALNSVRPSVSEKDLEHYVKWDNTYGSGSSR